MIQWKKKLHVKENDTEGWCSVAYKLKMKIKYYILVCNDVVSGKMQNKL